MSEKDYSVHPKYLEEADYRVLILCIPEDEIEDKLAYLAREKGKITRGLFEDFLIATCIANINQLLFHINSNLGGQPIDMEKIRAELVGAILDVNPPLKPSNIHLNKNFVLKLNPKDRGLDDDEKPLTSTKVWSMNQSTVLSEQPPPPPEEAPVKKKSGKKGLPKKSIDELKDINDLEYSTVERWWKRLGRYVTIKQFDKEDAEHLLAKRYFHNRTSFQTFVVSVCIDDFEELFGMLDEMGIPGRIAPPILINELYELCLYCNDFLTFENAQSLVDEPVEEEEQPKDPRHRSRTAGTMKNYIKKGPKKGFKDVPKQDLLSLGENMKVFLIGQDESVDSLTDSIQRASVGLKDPNKPIGSFLFAGRTGVGKTLASKVLANELIKGRDNIVTIDCSEYSADHEYSKLIGAPSGYVGYEAGGVLTNAIHKNPFCVVVFDEVEKASHKVHELLLQILEEGRLTDGKGKPANFNEAIIIMTSNVGVKEIDDIKKTIGFGNVAEITDEKKDKALTEALKKKFKPEFLNRIDAIINFKNLKKDDYMRIIDIELYKLNDNLKNNATEYKDVELEFSKAVKSMVYKEGINEEYGARPLKRCVEQKIATPLAKFLLGEDFSESSVVHVDFKRGKLKFEIEKKVVDPPLYMNKEYQDMVNDSLEGV